MSPVLYDDEDRNADSPEYGPPRTRVVVSQENAQHFSSEENGEAEDRWDNYHASRNEPVLQLLHCALPELGERYKLMSQSALLKYIETNPLTPMEVLIAVEKSSNGNRQFRIMPIARLHNEFVAGNTMFVHELLAADRPIKPYFDIDFSNVEEDIDDEFCATTLRRFINYLSASAGFNTDFDDWILMITPYREHPDAERQKKFSAHLVYRRWYFHNSMAFCAWLKERVDVERCTTEFHMDFQVYTRNHTMRILGGSKFVSLVHHKSPLSNPPARFPKLCFNPPVSNKLMDFGTYSASLIQNVAGSVLIGDALPAADNARVRDVGDLRRREACCEFVVARLKQWGADHNLNLDLDYSAVNILPNTFSPHEVRITAFKLDNYEGYANCRHQGSDIRVRCFVDSDCFEIDCESCGTLVFGINDVSERLVREMEFVKFLFEISCDRPDFPFPGSNRSPGFFAMTDETFYKQLQVSRRAEVQQGKWIPIRDFVTRWLSQEDTAIPWNQNGDPLPIPFAIIGRGATGVFNLEMVKFINARYPVGDDGISVELIAYINCFLAVLGKNYVMYEIGEQSAAQVKEFLANVRTLKWSRAKPTKAIPEPPWVSKAVPCFDLWRASPHRRTFGSPNPGDLLTFSLNFSIGSRLNRLMPVAFNLAECLETFQKLDLPTRVMLLQMYKALINMYVFAEPDEKVRDEMRFTFYRFYHACIFEYWNPKKIAIFLLSLFEGGQGKSWGGEMIGLIVGQNHARVYDGNAWNKDMFDTINGLMICNEISFPSGRDGVSAGANYLKGRITSPEFTDRRMYKDAGRVQNLTCFWLSSNEAALEALAQPGMERRVMVAKCVDVDEYDNSNVCRYECTYCDDFESCPHSFLSHAELMTLFRDKVFPHQKGRSAFCGMLYYFFQEERIREPARWAMPMGTWCPQTSAGAKLRELTQDSVETFLMKCVERGYHFTARIVPPSNTTFKSITLTRSQFNRLTDDAVNMDRPLMWEEKVTEKSFYSSYRWFCLETGMHHDDQTSFVNKFKSFYQKRVQRSQLPMFEMNNDCLSLDWQKDDMGSTMKWTLPANPVIQQKVWVMGAPWGPRMEETARQRLAARERVREDMTRSSSLNSSFADALRQRDDSNSPYELPNFPRHLSTSASCFALEDDDEEERVEAGMGIMNMVRRLRDDDAAQDGFQPIFGGEDVEVNHEEQDRIARMHDERVKRRRQEQQGFIDEEAAHSERSESSDFEGL